MSEKDNKLSSSEEQVRPATIQDLLVLIDAFNRSDTPYMLIGGFGMLAHGFSRSTRDIDILFPANSEVGKKVIDVLLLMPEKAAKEIDPSWFDEGDNIRVNDAYTLDIMFNANGETFESLAPYMEKVEINGIKVCVPSIEGMLKTKLTGRQKDVADEIALRRQIQAERELSGDTPAEIRKETIFRRIARMVLGFGDKSKESAFQDDEKASRIREMRHDRRDKL